ncbi:MAG: c-type cytochrome [Bacteroidetes bacterium]|nr:c-type cytochrome [Bacteroidota bacterium]
MNKLMSHFSFKSLFGAVFLIFTFSFGLKAQDGAKLFKQNCAVCHSLGAQKLTGPGLAGVFDRVPKPAEAWLHAWIMNNEKVIKSGDAYATKLYADNGKAAMTVFEGQLNDKDVDAIIAYIKNPPPDKPTTTTTTTGGEVAGTEAASGIDPLYLLLGAIVIIALVAGALRSVRFAMQNAANRKEGKPEEQSLTYWEEIKQWMGSHRRLVGVFSIILVFGGMKSCWDACYDIGVYYDWETQKGYHPEQPIKFSHKIHAGDNEIACQYCHNSVEKSRHAGIPTVNVCMNCHKGIQEGPTTGKTEIAKIHAAAGFDPNTGNYDVTKQNPIKWVKVYTLPDFVYFSHQQHVVVGKQECATCHGDVKKMTTVEQKNPLTMKWCIECHRKTEVAMEGNAYYDKLHAALKEKYKGQYDVKFTVEKIGGLECGKCHY